MQYLVSVIDDTAGLATPDEMAAINTFNDQLKAEGQWVFAGGLAAPNSATVIDNRGEEAMFTDGPFLESKEYLLRRLRTIRLVEAIAGHLRRRGRHSPFCLGLPSAVSGAVASARRKAAASTTAATQRLCRTPTRSPRKPTTGGPARKAT